MLAFVIQTEGVAEVRPNAATDPAFAQAVEDAIRAGVTILFLPCIVEPDRLTVRPEIRFPLEGFRRFEDLEDAASLEADAETIRAAYLEELAKFDGDLERLVRGLSHDLVPVDSHDSVGPPLAALLSRREAAWRARRRS